MSEGRDPHKEKQLDYSRERRSKAWSSDKADRKKRSLAKAMEHRADRRAASQALDIDPHTVSEDEAEALQQTLGKKAGKRLALEPTSVPLGEHVEGQLARRQAQREAAAARQTSSDEE
ncbi:MAG: hypothetical protein P1V51_23560 [Deltaproteobacteria bacterium]|nr:hypothetical protein [Deltaproteobacteria bacterium]